MKDLRKSEADSEAPELSIPKRIRYQMLCVLWSFPSMGAVVILLRIDPPWTQGGGVSDALRKVPLEAWIALTLLAMHATWFYLWYRSRKVQSANSA